MSLGVEATGTYGWLFSQDASDSRVFLKLNLTFSTNVILNSRMTYY
jgi:hypothetical protein